METIGKRLGAAIKGWGSKSGFLREMRERNITGATFPSLNAYLSDKVSPRLEFLLAAADVLGVRLQWLQEGEGDVLRAPSDLSGVAPETAAGIEQWSALEIQIAQDCYRDRFVEIFPEIVEARVFTWNMSEGLFAQVVISSFGYEDEYPQGNAHDVARYAADLEAGRLPAFVADAIRHRADNLFHVLLGPASWIHEALWARGAEEEFPAADMALGYIHSVIAGFQALLTSSIFKGWQQYESSILKTAELDTDENERGPVE